MKPAEIKASSTKQRQLIALARNQIGIDETDYRSMLQNRYQKKSSTELTFSEADELLDEFVKKGFVIKTDKRRYLKRPAGKIKMPRKPGQNVVVLASPAELEKFNALAGLVKWRVENGCEKWMKKFLGIETVKTCEDVYRAIEGLKKLISNGMKKEHGKDWWLMDFVDTAMCEFISEHLPAEYKDFKVPALVRLGYWDK
ncbi:phage protein GemA/Gp16 family protein [Desulforegula conservatrix]|uniref:phage protein GemA/Gp16 family protein n=1 Tax=Desulforegula conservatrix TaxID=153026 RepID=UPI00042009A3|nr:phage protein GemA/Gp16 family protein [Desulforegula conservatrix]